MYYPAEQGTAIDELPQSFRGIVVLGLSNGKVYMGLRGLHEDKDLFKQYLPGAKWEPVPHTKSWLVEMTNANQKEVLAALVAAKKEMMLPDVAIEGCKPSMRDGIVSLFMTIGIL